MAKQNAFKVMLLQPESINHIDQRFDKRFATNSTVKSFLGLFPRILKLFQQEKLRKATDLLPLGRNHFRATQWPFVSTGGKQVGQQDEVQILIKQSSYCRLKLNLYPTKLKIMPISLLFFFS